MHHTNAFSFLQMIKYIIYLEQRGKKGSHLQLLIKYNFRRFLKKMQENGISIKTCILSFVSYVILILPHKQSSLSTLSSLGQFSIRLLLGGGELLGECNNRDLDLITFLQFMMQKQY